MWGKGEEGVPSKPQQAWGARDRRLPWRISVAIVPTCRPEFWGGSADRQIHSMWACICS